MGDLDDVDDVDAETEPTEPEPTGDALLDAFLKGRGVDLHVLQECPKHKDEHDRQLLYFKAGQKPSDVLGESVDLVVKENNDRLALGGFHPGLVFRSPKGESFVTLIEDDEGRLKTEPITGDNIGMALQRRFCFLKPRKDDPWFHDALPGWFKNTIGGMVRYKFPVLAGLLQHPAIHLDGGIVTREGYDPVTKCWVVNGWADTVVPEKPTVAQVEAAIATLREPFEEVIFKDDEIEGSAPVKKPGTDMTASEANALGMVLTMMLRREIADAPYFVITSTQWGTAKGLIASVASFIAQNAGPTLSPVQSSKDQAEKQIGRILQDRPDAKIIQFDEPHETGGSGRLHSRLLALLATAGGTVEIRNVYSPRVTEIDTQRTMVFTGNSLHPDKDLVRRVSVIELDIPNDGTLPHERTFKHADRSNKPLLLAWVRANRSRFIEAALMLVANWKAKGCPPADFEFDFAQWVHTVGGILQAAGVTAWMANRNEVYANAEEAQRAAFVLAVADAVGTGPISTRNMAEKLTSHTRTKDVKDLLVMDDTWAKLLYRTWGDPEPMTYNLGRLLGTLKDRLLNDGKDGRVTVSDYEGHRRTKQWIFTVAHLSSAPVKPKGGRLPRS